MIYSLVYHLLKDIIMEGFTYILTLNNSPVFYIGSTSNLKKRFLRHKNCLIKGTHHNQNLQNAWNISKSTDIKVGIMFSGEIEKAREQETNEIRDRLGNPNMANIGIQAIGGDNYLRHPSAEKLNENKKIAMRRYFDNLSEEKREKLRERSRGKNNPMYGKTHTKEVRERISKHHLGHSYNKGCKLSSEHIAKISARQKLRTGPKNSFYGKKHSLETRKHLSKISQGRKSSNRNIIRINSKEYQSQNDAAKALNVSPKTILFRLRSKNPRFKDYEVVKRWSATSDS